MESGKKTNGQHIKMGCLYSIYSTEEKRLISILNTIHLSLKIASLQTASCKKHKLHLANETSVISCYSLGLRV